MPSKTSNGFWRYHGNLQCKSCLVAPEISPKASTSFTADPQTLDLQNLRTEGSLRLSPKPLIRSDPELCFTL